MKKVSLCDFEKNKRAYYHKNNIGAKEGIDVTAWFLLELADVIVEKRLVQEDDNFLVIER